MIAIYQYLSVMKLNSITLETKARYHRTGHWFFLSSVLSVAVVLLMTLIGIASGITFVESTETPENAFPISDAGSDRVVIENGTVVLDGSDSQDQDGIIRSYLRNQMSGLRVNLSSNNIISQIDPDWVNNSREKYPRQKI